MANQKKKNTKQKVKPPLNEFDLNSPPDLMPISGPDEPPEIRLRYRGKPEDERILEQQWKLLHEVPGCERTLAMSIPKGVLVRVDHYEYRKETDGRVVKFVRHTTMVEVSMAAIIPKGPNTYTLMSTMDAHMGHMFEQMENQMRKMRGL